jgi:hypothetical protein
MDSYLNTLRLKYLLLIYFIPLKINLYNKQIKNYDLRIYKNKKFLIKNEFKVINKLES